MNAIGLNFDPISERKLGKSKLGGKPDLPENLPYPKNANGYDIPFLCQLNLGEFDNEIASEGILYFFCQLDDTTEYGAVLFSKDTKSLISSDPQHLDVEITYPLTERAISFKVFEELLEGDENYYEVMGRSRIGGSIFKAGADYSEDGRVSLLQLNSNEIEELEGEVEEFIHFFIDLTDLISLNFANVFVTSQH
ncbi:DUF1963 domain-containing protein [Leptospira borgpetersenii]|uniref:PF09234 domain protein n=2 Tax=Leptospira borgpetersenii TaxID=174 RepID=A0A0E3B2V1_LEPBO|nr:DUF1963 domain-containing protein [Leptospira borgpetersenii]ALO24985.1 hypothetical protein LBBP_00645 [Leptospira borgpetersenii serovar Ballum]ANH00010.1 PF09234 domain protein [Leptospira borgpetersenii str. 4E]EKR02234.1 PF09234 domain protein [Leptospira borgpetersenii serovar Castellonis str. 200801910]KGE24782.1 hypothetical protein IQ66_06705 [Leptospira borgpetersenii serovar Ballum]MBE8160974.1 DUF1963 domain-containing protein [Leptospira borgpetersenii serovar Ballum]